METAAAAAKSDPCLTLLFTRNRSKWTADGPKAWSIVLGSFLTNLSVLGLVYSFGIFVSPLVEEFGRGRAEVALIGTLSLALFFLGGVFSGALGDRYGVRPVMSVGWVIWMVGCISTSFVQQFELLYFTHGILVGVGASLAYWPGISVVPQWFDRYRATAAGLSALGSGIGSLIFALAGQKIIDALGWRNTIRVFMGFGGGLLLIAILVMERRFPPLQKPGGLFFVAKRLIKVSSYRCFLLATFFFQFGFFVPYVHLTSYIRDVGLDTGVQSLALAMIGVGSCVGRLVTGPIADTVGKMLVFQMCMLATAITIALWPVCSTADSFYCFGFFFGLFSGGFIALSPVIAGEFWGVANLGGTFVLLNLLQFPGGIASGPIAAAIEEAAGSWDPAIWTAAAFVLLCFICLMFVRKDATSPQSETQEDAPEAEKEEEVAATNSSQQSPAASSTDKAKEEEAIVKV